ncbi:hypothetical protein GGR51DRAFT_559706 [Nemania sp. FL0031]|nr:hypothetical protein GGR51DRAFT_559706 [Nemania sp. FL0031]
MASYSQPGFRIHESTIHDWRVPSHFLFCSRCRDERSRNIQQDADNARTRAMLMATPVYGPIYKHRLLSLSPRLTDCPFPGIIRQRGSSVLDTGRIPRRVTIQVPSLNSPVRPDQTPIQSPLSFRPSRKRSSDFSDIPEPAQYFVPEQSAPAPHPVPHHFHTQASPDFWVANSERIREAIGLRTPASPPTETNNQVPMPGTWPSWVDDPNGIDPRLQSQRYETINSAVDPPAGNAPVGILGLLSSFALGTLRSVLWRPIRFVLAPQLSLQPDRPAHPGQPARPIRQLPLAPLAHESAQFSNAASTIGPVGADNDFRAPKRSRYDERPSEERPSNPARQPLSISQSLLRRGRKSNEGQVQIHARRGEEYGADPNFNYAGHFSLDAMYDASDSEDEEYPGSPMDIDSPDPVVLNQSGTIPARQPILPECAQPPITSDEQKPIALNQSEVILAKQPIESINPETKPKLAPAVAAARRAVKLFPKDPAVPKTRASSSTEGSAPVKTPSLEHPPFATPAIERIRRKAAGLSASANTHVTRTTDKAQYEKALEFFPNDIVHSLPGLEGEQLPADARKIEHLKREFMERVRQEEIEALNASLRRLGLRRPMSTLITAPSPEWINRALDAPKNGHFDHRAVHADAVELKPRDFARLVPSTAWLNDDCVHSTLCCLATYVNKKAGFKPLAHAPRCVAISSLYWKSFCSDHNKLYPRPFLRKWGMTQQNFLKIDTVLIPVNLGAHWTLIVIRPSRKTISYLDSFHAQNPAQLRHAYQWVELFLGNKFVASEWNTQELGTPKQTNAWDCGMFVITNAMCLALGVSPLSYNEDNMPMQRQRIAAMLLNGGFHGEFDLGHI